MSETLESVKCPVCGKEVAVRGGRIVYHKWLLDYGRGYVPCSGVGREARFDAFDADEDYASTPHPSAYYKREANQ